MIEITGKYTDAKIYHDNVEEFALLQIKNVCDHPIFEGCPIRIMPDVHAGAGCVIGFSSPLPKNGEIIPNLIGVDIGCGMNAYKIKGTTDDYAKIDMAIQRNVPYGFHGRKTVSSEIPQKLSDEIIRISTDILNETGEDAQSHLKKIGSLGSGNHFIELNQTTSGEIYLVIHSGSRNFGLKIAEYYQKLAMEKNFYEERKQVSYLSDGDAQNYLRDMKVAQKYASLNREIIAKEIINAMEWEIIDSFETIHNYISDDNVIRKGAISAKADELVLIPLNMRDGSIIARGKGNADWNNTAPHGAGRIMSRTAAKNALTMEEYKKSMTGIYSSRIFPSTLDEAPMAYKNAAEIVQYIKPTAEVLEIIKPVYNFKG